MVSRPNIAHFEVPADDVVRAINFYNGVFGWEIKKSDMPGVDMEYWLVTTGKSKKNTLNVGGMMKRMQPTQQITNYVEVKKLEKVLAKVKELGGKQLGEIMVLKGVGRFAQIMDSENNALALWEPEKKPKEAAKETTQPQM